MRIIEKMTEKWIYNRPEIVCVELDYEISLALESTPPIGPDEGIGYIQQNPFKAGISLV